MMRKFLLSRWVLMGLVATGLALAMPAAKPAMAADYNTNRLMDDAIFDKVGSMNEAAIQSFLASKGPCLANYTDVDPTWTGSTWTYTGSVAASHIIYKAAQQWGLNPQVIIATLQKEESLITGTSCDTWRYNSAMGYGCPDSGGCNPKYVGFTRQVLWGAWQMKFNKERSYGNTAWDGDGDITYVGLMTQGARKRCDTCQTFTYDGNATIDGQVIHLDNGPTASFYTYTPHLGQALPGIFESWFGSVMVPTYAWQIAGQYAYSDATKTAGKGTTGLLPGDRVYVGVQARNMGNTTWVRDGAHPVKLGTVAPGDRMSSFCDSWASGCNRPATMQEATVAPGEVATFEFWMKASTPGVFNERFTLVAEGAAWMNDPGLDFYMTVAVPVWSWQMVGQYAYSDQTKTTGKGTGSLLPGDRVYVGFQARNTGNTTWKNSGANPVHVGMTHPLDRLSLFSDASWLGQNRPANLIESSVPPGGVGTFEFWMNAPAQTGTYLEYFSLVAEGAAWMNDPGLNFHMVVSPPIYSWQMVGQYAYSDQTKTAGKGTTGLHAGDRVYVGFQARNTGNVTWSNSGTNPIHVGMTHPIDRLSLFFDGTWLGQNRPAVMKEASVPPGGVGTFEYWMKAPSQTGTFLEFFDLVAEGKAWMTGPDLNFYSTVVP